MKNITKVLKAIIISILSLTVGYLAISIPFRLFNTLDSDAMRMLFIGELIIYITVLLIFLVSRDKVRIKKEKEEQRKFQREEKIKQLRTEWIDLAA